MKRIVGLGLVLSIVGVLATVFAPNLVFAMTGSGTPGDPYVVYNVTDLQNVANNLTACYKLANDIDASDTCLWNGGDGFDPIGISGTPFTGSFNGSGYSISELYIDRSGESYVGLFGAINNGATIQDVTLTDCDIDGLAYVGALVGEALSSVTPLNTTISGCSANGSIASSLGGSYIGGLIGTAYETTVTDCDSACDVTSSGDNRMGGFAGQTGKCSVTNCYATGDVAGEYYIGGFVGYDYYASSFTNCFAFGNATGETTTGGFGGELNGSTISRCFATGDVDCNVSWYEAGGFAGLLTGSGTITDAYCRGDVIGNTADEIGGFVGENDGFTITNAYSTGAVYGFLDVGGFCGKNGGTITACFWDTETSLQSSSDGGTGKTTAEMKTESTFTSVGWDFTNVWGIDAPVNNGYPFFIWQNPWASNYTIYQVLWFQPNAIISGTTLPDRAGTEDGIITWGANPAGIAITLGDFVPEEEYEFEPIIPVNPDIIKPEPEVMTGDVDLEALRSNPLYPLVQVLSIDGFLNERLVWLGLAWLIVIVAMFLVHIGPDTRRGTNKPQHFILTVGTGLGLSILFYVWGIFPWWVILLMGMGLIPAIIWERQPVM